jgi:lysophospholipase L1-like esterase
MKTQSLTGAILLGFIVSGFTQPKQVTPKTPAKAVAQDPAFEPATDDPKLPRILLIGDSISMGYTVPVRNLLQGKANAHRIPENGGPTTSGLANLKKWLGEGQWDVIHFNWGLHDLKIMSDGKHQVSAEAYEKNLRELVRRLKATGATLIWASTTPVPEGKLNPPRANADVLAYNAIAKKIMEENQIPTDDLYSVALPQLSRIQRPENVHFTSEGSEVLAKEVTASIASALGHKK